jgi:hypothetical protein
MSLLRILRFSPLVGVMVLLPASCGTHSTVSGTSFNSPSTGSITGSPAGDTGSPPTEGTGGTGSPPTEGIGPESPQSPSNSGVSVSLAGLPIGNTSPEAENDNGSAECVIANWLGQVPAGVTVTATVTSVVAAYPFTVTDLTTAGCAAAPADEHSPPCVGSQFSTTDINNGAACLVGVEWAGTEQPPTSGYLEFFGELSCPNADSATCQKIGGSILNGAPPSQSIRFDFCAPDCGLPSPTTSTAPPTGTSSVSTSTTPPTGTSPSSSTP